MEILTRKYGPLPGWAWLGIIGIGGYLFLRSHPGGGSSSAGGDTGSGSQFDLGIAPTSAIPSSTRQPGWWDKLTPKQRKKARADVRKAGNVPGA